MKHTTLLRSIFDLGNYSSHFLKRVNCTLYAALLSARMSTSINQNNRNSINNSKNVLVK